MSTIRLIHGDCIDMMQWCVPDGSIDLVLTDPPYGTTACKWDSVIPFGPMWEQIKRVVKPNAAICLFGSEPFSSALRMSNLEFYRHEWYWNKNNSAGFATAKLRPFSIIENVICFSYKKPNYMPLMEIRGKIRAKGGYGKSENYGIMPKKSRSNSFYPKNLLNFGNAVQKGKLHPTQKPVALLEYLIKTYTKEGETVLDFTMGSGSTGVACKNLNRHFIGIEQDKTYFGIAKKRCGV